MYGKLFEQIFDSSIAEDYMTRFVFEDFIILADADGVVDMTPEAMSRRTNVPIDVIRRAIEKLEQPDPKSRSPDEDGRRIVRLDEHRDWGWRVVNHTKYRSIKNESERRTYMRNYMRNRRAVNSLQELTELTDANSACVSASDSASVSGKKKGKKKGEVLAEYSPAFLVFWGTYPKRWAKAKAWNAWVRRGCDAIADTIMKALHDHMGQEQWKERNGRWIPKPENWIDQRRWEDEIAKPRKSRFS